MLGHGAPSDFNRLRHTPSKHNSWIGFPITMGIKFPHVNPGGGVMVKLHLDPAPGIQSWWD